MTASAAKIESNRANSLKSTGPKSIDGKARSRANSLTHGLCSKVVLHPDDQAAIAVGVEPAPTTPTQGFDRWLTGQMAVASTKIERCQAMERAARSKLALRASVTWDDDRRLDAIKLASKLGKRPEAVAAALRESYHGCEWLGGRWALLAHAADTQAGGWTPEQASLAFDLLGTPIEFREGVTPGTTIGRDGKPEGPGPSPAAVAWRAIDELNGRLELLGPVDEADRERTEAELSDDEAEIRRLRRYEAEQHRRLNWAIGLFKEVTAPRDPSTEPTPTPDGDSEAAPEPTPPRQATMPAPARPLSRAEGRLIKAESRREAKRRKKLDRLLA